MSSRCRTVEAATPLVDISVRINTCCVRFVKSHVPKRNVFKARNRDRLSKSLSNVGTRKQSSVAGSSSAPAQTDTQKTHLFKPQTMVCSRSGSKSLLTSDVNMAGGASVHTTPTTSASPWTRCVLNHSVEPTAATPTAQRATLLLRGAADARVCSRRS